MPAPELNDETYVAVSIGELKTGVANILTGIDEIKGTLAGQDSRLRGVENRQAALTTRVDTIDTTMKATSARRAPWTAIAAIVIAAIAVVVRFFQ